MVTIKFIFDIASPNGYLCHKVIPNYEKNIRLNLIMKFVCWEAFISYPITSPL